MEIEYPDKKLAFFIAHDKNPFTITKDFSLANAWWMAELSRLVYFDDKEKIQDALASVGFNVKFFFETETEAMVVWNDKMTISVFRGTEPGGVEDIRTDLIFTTERSKFRGKVHEGFKSALDLIWPEYQLFMAGFSVNQPRFFTGHSLGAALATLAAGRLNGTAIYTFGSPRVGNGTFARGIDETIPHYRIVNYSDIVTKIPPVIFGFRHCGELRLLNEKGELFKKPSLVTKMLKSFKEFGWVTLISFVLFFDSMFRRIFMGGVADHNPVNYSVCLYRLLNMK